MTIVSVIIEHTLIHYITVEYSEFQGAKRRKTSKGLPSNIYNAPTKPALLSRFFFLFDFGLLSSTIFCKFAKTDLEGTIIFVVVSCGELW